MKGIAVPRYSFDDDDLGRCRPIVGLDDSAAPGRASIRVFGQAGRGRRLLERKDVAVEPAARQFAGQL